MNSQFTSSLFAPFQKCTLSLHRVLIPFPLRKSRFPRRQLSYSSTAMAMEITPNQPNRVEFLGTEYQVIQEGLAKILNPPAQDAASKGTKKDLKADDEIQSVFYNPIQQFNRDLSVLAIRAFGEHSVDLRKKKLDSKLKRNGQGNGASKGTKRKREDSAEARSKELPETNSEKPIDGKNVRQDAQSDPSAAPSFTVLDALSATGLRALRYASELPMVTKVVANDLSSSAIDSMKINIDYNELQERIQPNLGDARAYMYSLNVHKFDVIDLDPYGSASPFIDAAVQGVKDGGLLCVTCTDAGVWASTGYAEKAFSLYGGTPIKGCHSHEGGLRLILNNVAMSAAKYGLSIEPLLSLSIDFYARVFVRVYRSPAQVKFTAGNSMVVYNCDSGCGAWSTQPLALTKQKLDRKGNPMYHHVLAQGPIAGQNCEHCGFKTHIAGPMWGGPLHNPHFIQKILGLLPTLDSNIYHTIPRIEGMLTNAFEEDLDLIQNSEVNKNSLDLEYPAIVPRTNPAIRDPYPFYFTLSALSKVLHCSTTPIDEFHGALRSIGYRSTRSHAKPNSIRTDAPWSVIWEVMREWVRQHSPIKEANLKPGSPGLNIMNKSRDNLRKVHEGDPWLSQLKKDLLAAVESGRDFSDLITKVEASLYRSGLRQTEKAEKTAPKQSETLPDVEQSQEEALEKVEASETPSGPPHPSSLDIKFDAALGRQTLHSNKRLVRYQLNPRANWGPLNRAAVKLK